MSIRPLFDHVYFKPIKEESSRNGILYTVSWESSTQGKWLVITVWLDCKNVQQWDVILYEKAFADKCIANWYEEYFFVKEKNIYGIID